jgi:hypothetical protein
MKARVLLAGLAIMVAGLLPAQHTRHDEYEVKAAFLYNFAKFVEWPPEAIDKTGESFVIGILGRDPFAKEWKDQLDGKVVQDRKLVFRRLSSPAEAAGCRVVFISDSEAGEVSDILAKLEGPPVLTVSDVGRFIQRGGMVGFSVEQNKVRFSVNVTAAEKAGLKISSQLLKLAKTVKGKPSSKPY